MKFEFADFRIDTETRQLLRRDQTIDIQPKVFELVVFLISNRHRVVSKDELIEHVWEGRIVSDSALNASINSVRQALGDNGKAQRVIKTFSRRGFRFVAEILDKPRTQEQVPLSAAQEFRPTVAVLPFVNLSGDPEQDYFSNGMAVDLSIDLSKHPNLKTLSRNSAFSIGADRNQRFQTVQALGISHLVEGSVRKMSERVRVSVELTEATTGETLWAERYDGSLDELFDFQDEIRDKIVTALSQNLLGLTTMQSSARGTRVIEAYDLYLRGRERYFNYTPDGLRDAIEYLKAAITLDPEFSDAYGYLAYFYTAVRTLKFIEMDDPMGLAEQSAHQAVKLSSGSALANTWLAWVYGLSGRHQDAYELFEKALKLDEMLPEVYTYFGSICIYGGRPEKALELSERALELQPFAPPSWDFHVGQAYHLRRDYNKAIAKYEDARRRIPKFTSLRLHMAAVYWEAGHLEAAMREIEAVLDIAPGYNLNMAAENYPYVSGELQDRFLSALESAGLPQSQIQM
ncbi:Transcriptional regulator HilA [Roseibium album]|nr:Transcriptional regulator HilA [Roseibium album]